MLEYVRINTTFINDSTYYIEKGGKTYSNIWEEQMFDLKNIIPSHIRTVTLRVQKRSGKAISGSFAYPPDLIRAHNHRDGDLIVIAYICKAGEKSPDTQEEEK